MTTLTTATNPITVRWPSPLITGARFAGHFVLALATVLFVGADHAEY
ncbi:hypothetical protein [Kutzneria sp. NPDC052558]